MKRRRKGKRSWKQISRIKGLTMKQKARLYRGRKTKLNGKRRTKRRNHPLRISYRGKRLTRKQLVRRVGKRKARKLFSKKHGRIFFHGKTRMKKANSRKRGRRGKRRNFRR